MVRKEFVDRFFYEQPEMLFEKDLREKENIKIFDIPAKAEKGFALINSVKLNKGEFENLDDLSVIFADFDEFCTFNGIKGTDYTIELIKDEKFVKEKFLIDTTANCTKLYVGDYISVIRAILYVEHQLVINHGQLKIESKEVNPIFDGRVTRCFFSPTNRPPKNGDELNDDIDYYPENYLQKLMHDNITGLWIYTCFNALATNSSIPEYGIDRERRQAKLNSVINRAKKYGIGIYIFCMEPVSLDDEAVTRYYPQVSEKYKQSRGNRNGDSYAFCAHTEFAENYLRDSIREIFTACPGLKGMISITQGERWTSCQNMVSDVEGKLNVCPRCGHIPRPENLDYTINLIKKYMKEVNPDLEYVSWTYGHRGWEYDEIVEYVKGADDEIILMQNFEDRGVSKQLDREVIAMDYWLSYTGPSEMFKITAEAGRKYPHRVWGKIQACCSHEIASVPYIPAPGIIFDKMQKAEALGVTGFMESWYFGNYPSLMSRAIGLYSFGKYADKQAFLLDLARLYWSEEEAKKVVEAWNYFEAGYSNYPICSLMGYYGPAHDSVVWDLALKPRNFSLPRSWLLLDPPDGDRIGECIWSSHPLSNILKLYTLMCENWKKGVEVLDKLGSLSGGEFNEQYSNAQAIGILFASAKNIVEFYSLRNQLGYELGDNQKIFDRMKAIVYEEIENSTKMIELCNKDGRLGYHSEAEGYKFFPVKLQDRIDKLNKLLETEFVEVQDRINKKLPPLEYYIGADGDGLNKYKHADSLEKAEWAYLNDNDAKFKLAFEGDEIKLELYNTNGYGFYVASEYELGLPQSAMYFRADGTVGMQTEAITHQTMFGEKLEKEIAKWKVENLSKNDKEIHLIASIKIKDSGFFRFPYKFMVKTAWDRYAYHSTWQTEENPICVLGKKMHSPNEFGWVE